MLFAMSSTVWKKAENDAGYPCYIDDLNKRQVFDHPQFRSIMDSLNEYDSIKYSVYKVAYKMYQLQKQIRVPPIRITTGVFSRHQLSLSESSLSLDATELEAVLADIYFAAEKEGLFSGDVDLAVDLLINLLLNVFDSDRKEPIRVLSAKTLLVILSEDSCLDKWQALANFSADHNGCVSPRRLATLLNYITSIAKFVGDKETPDVQEDVDACFSKSAGMLGVSARSVAEWAVISSSSTKWMPVLSRIQNLKNHSSVSNKCCVCDKNIIMMLKFRCAKCSNTYFCDKCYLYEGNYCTVSGHKKSHLVVEVIDGETNPSECLSFMKGVRRFLFCTKNKKKKTKNIKKDTEKSLDDNGSAKRRKDAKPAMITSTVGKASGNKENHPTTMLQDIISQLENQNKALQELSDQLQNMGKDTEERLKTKVEIHATQISTQINRLKILKENLSLNTQSPPTNDSNDKERIQAFDLFSPIPPEEKQSKVTGELKNQPRVLSLDSGNFSVTSKQTNSHLMAVSGNDLKPIGHATTDSISTVSMNDISTWYHAPETTDQKAQNQSRDDITNDFPSQSLCMSEQKFEADLRSVASSNDKMKELNADLDTVLDRLHQILTNNFAIDDSCLDNTQLRETANEMEGLLGSLIRGVEQRVTLNATKTLV